MKSASLAALAFVIAVSACGTDVDLGGAGDAGSVVSPSLDATAPGGECAPCLVASDCTSGLCAKFAGYLFCSTACSTTAPCSTGQTCAALLAPDDAKISACLPNDTKCAPDNGPIGPDGAPLEHCGTNLDAPPVASKCKACNIDTDECQPNGCYGGYWCNSDTVDCLAPPKTCN